MPVLLKRSHPEESAGKEVLGRLLHKGRLPIKGAGSGSNSQRTGGQGWDFMCAVGSEPRVRLCRSDSCGLTGKMTASPSQTPCSSGPPGTSLPSLPPPLPEASEWMGSLGRTSLVGSLSDRFSLSVSQMGEGCWLLEAAGGRGEVTEGAATRTGLVISGNAVDTPTEKF